MNEGKTTRKSYGFRGVEHIEEIAIDNRTPRDVMTEMEVGTTDSDAGRKNQRNMNLAILGVGNFAAEHPAQWRTFHCKLHHPDATNQELATMLGITEGTVRRHVSAFMLCCEIKD